MMRKLLFSTVVLVCFQSARSQVYIDGNDMNKDTSVQYIEVVQTVYPSIFTVESVDAGGKRNSKLTDAAGKKLPLRSPVDVMDHMARNGWRMLRRDMFFEPRHDGGTAHAYVLFERISIAPAR